jgi:hypothetical protein
MAHKIPAAAASAEPSAKVKDDDVRVHAHQRGGFGIERDGAHRRAHLGFQHDEPQREQQNQSDGKMTMIWLLLRLKPPSLVIG